MVKHFVFTEEMKLLLSEGVSMTELMEEIRREWCKQNLKDCSESDNISQCIMQMMVLKIQSIIKLCEGVPCPSYTPQPLFLDSSSIVSLLRCLYEEVFIFHNVFATERSCKEKTIILNLWKIKGLNNKILSENDLFEETETEEKKAFLNEYGSKIERTKMQVEQLKEEINALCGQMDITPKAIEQIQDNIKHQKRSIKGYEFIKDGSRIIAFKHIDFACSPEKVFGTKKLNPFYQLLSAHSHPSYMGITGFGTMYNNGGDIRLLKMVIRGICILSAIVITDFCKTVKNGQAINERIPQRIKDKLIAYTKVS